MARQRTGIAHWLVEAEVPLLVLDRARRVRVFNRGLQQVTGLHEAEVLGQRAVFARDESSTLAPSTLEQLLTAVVPSDAEFAGAVRTADVLLPTLRGLEPRQAVSVPLAPDDPASRPRGSESHLLILLLPPQPAVPGEAALTLHAELAAARARLQARDLPPSLVADASAMQRPLRQLALAVRSGESVHLDGEPGTGRRAFALAIHRQQFGPPPPEHSLSHTQKDTPTHTGLGPSWFGTVGDDDRLLLFAIERPRRPQQLRSLLAVLSPDPETPATPRTLVLADIDRLPLDVQAEIVQAWPELSQPPRLLTTSTRSLPDLLSGGDVFLPEFASLLGTQEIHLPPLRQRLVDVSLLAQAEIEATLVTSGRDEPVGLARETLTQLLEYGWPGNIAELRRCIAAAAVRADGPLIEPGDLPLQFETGRHAESLGPDDVLPPLAEVLAAAERRHIQHALEVCRGNKAAAAKRLGMNRPKLYRRLAALGLQDDEPSDEGQPGQSPVPRPTSVDQPVVSPNVTPSDADDETTASPSSS